MHLDHKGPLYPSSNTKTYRLVAVDAFSRFLRAYLLNDIGAQITVNAFEKKITSYGIPPKSVHANGSAFVNSDVIN